MSSLSHFCNRLLREPLVHFTVLGAGLFVLYSYAGGNTSEPADRIIVDETEIQRLAEQFQRTWMRPPSRQELAGLAEEFVREEILYREALALGLDQDDLVIRRRMRQKMEFLNADLVEQQTPSDVELQAYLDANPDKFRQPARLSFQQIYLGPEQNPQSAQPKAAALLQRLKKEPEAPWQELGESTLLPAELDKVSVRDIAGTFGTPLAEVIAAAPIKRWSGPYVSEYGVHLVRVTERTPEMLPPLSQIHAAVVRELTSERRLRANERFYQALRERYTVEIHLPDAIVGDKLAATQR